jgi:hypothetical protein
METLRNVMLPPPPYTVVASTGEPDSTYQTPPEAIKQARRLLGARIQDADFRLWEVNEFQRLYML